MDSHGGHAILPKRAFPLGSGSDDRPRWNQSSSSGIHSQVQSLERVRPEEHHVIRLGEHHPIRSQRPFGMHDGDANRSLEYPTVRDDETLHALWCHAELLQDRRGHPGELASRVDEHIVDRQLDPSSGGMLEGDPYAKGPHSGYHLPPGP
jgi:hypothetical protein